MSLVWVSRDGGGVVNGVFNLRQPGLADEQIDDQSADVLAFTGPAAVTGRLRAAALAMLGDPAGGVAGDPSALLKVMRGVVELLVDQFNLVFKRFTDQDAAVAAATTLINLQQRWNTVATSDPMPQRTNANAVTGIRNHINDGSAD